MAPFKSKAQQGYMFANEPKIAMKWAKETPNMKDLPQHAEESMGMQPQQPQDLHNDLEFFVVQMPMDHTAKVFDLVQQHNPISFAQACQEGTCNMNECSGFYMEEGEAHQHAYDLVKGKYDAAKSLEEKKELVASKLQKKIDQLDKEAQKHLKMAKQDVDNKDKHRAAAKALLNQIEQLESKNKAVSGSKKELQPLEEFEMPTAKKTKK